MIRICAAISFCWACGLYLTHALSYFFLKDDFAVLEAVQNHALGTIFTHGFFGFYRPVAVCFMQAQYALLGWEHPGAYMVVGLVVHGANALLVWLLARRLLGGMGAVLAGFLFFISPWAGEGFFWLSCVFDRLAAFGMLLALLLAVKAMEGSGRQVVLLGLLSFGACLAALFSKEVAVTLPVLLLIAFFLLHTRGAVVPFRRAGSFFLLFVVAAAVYLACRSLVIGAFQATYGNFFDLAHEVRIHRLVHPFFIPPVSLEAGFMARAGAVLFCAASAFAFCRALVRKPGPTLLLFAALLLSLCPVMVFKIHVMDTEGGRFIYVAGLFISMIFGLGFSPVGDNSLPKRTARRGPSLACSILLLVFFAHALQSLHYQTGLWRCASSVSRSCIEQFSEKIGHEKTHDENTLGEGAPDAWNYFIENLPSKLLQGPYVLNTYAFPYYFHDRKIHIRAIPVIVSYENGKLIEVEDEFPHEERKKPEEGELRIVFDY